MNRQQATIWNSRDMRFYNIIIAVMPERLILLREMVRILYFVK